MPRPSRYETYGDGENTYDDRYDAGEFDTYGQATSRGRGPSSGESYYDHAHCNEPLYDPSNFRPNRSTYDRDGYPREGSYAGEESLRHRLGRETYGYIDEPPYSELDPRTRIGRDDRSRSGYAAGRRSGLSQSFSADDRREERRQARREQELYQLELQLQAQQERERQRHGSRSTGFPSRDLHERSGRSGCRNAATAANDLYLAYAEAVRAEQQVEYDNQFSGGHGGSH